jgi:deoxyribonuclease-4
VNLASVTPLFLKKSIEAFRGEIERALALCAEYLVLHPGSFRGADREAGLLQTAAAINAASQGLDLAKGNLTILIENTAGAEYSLGGSFEQVAEVLDRLGGLVPVAACIDTCHTHVAGYDIVTSEGIEQTLAHLDETIGLKNVRVWHCNDAKAVRGSKLDRHQHIGKGTIGLEPFRRLLNHPRLAHAAFIAETPIDEPGDDRRNVEALKKLVSTKRHP